MWVKTLNIVKVSSPSANYMYIDTLLHVYRHTFTVDYFFTYRSFLFGDLLIKYKS
jgi:hypothetical protein